MKRRRFSSLSIRLAAHLAHLQTRRLSTHQIAERRYPHRDSGISADKVPIEFGSCVARAAPDVLGRFASACTDEKAPDDAGASGCFDNSGRSGSFAPSTQADTGEAETEQRERTGLGHLSRHSRNGGIRGKQLRTTRHPPSLTSRVRLSSPEPSAPKDIAAAFACPCSTHSPRQASLWS